MLKRRNLLIFTACLLVLGWTTLLTSTAYAQNVSNAKQNKSVSEINKTEQQEYNSALEYKLGNIEQRLGLQKEQTDAQLNKLEAIIENQKGVAEDLKLQVKSLTNKPQESGMTFEVWNGLLLACVSVIITVLGVAIAIITLIGGKMTVVASKQIAEETATAEAQRVASSKAAEVSLVISAKEAQETASRIVHQIMPEIAESKLRDHIDQGGFNKIIQEAIDKIAFSNIHDPENYTEALPNDPV